MIKRLEKNDFSFEISLSVLNHLGRNLYRSFATVLGEAISNAWDADAKNVYLYIDMKKDSFFIKDDGMGMKADDFQKKFLKIGYSKRNAGITTSPKGRPYIGRKGIGKLALLSCAKKITVISKISGGNYVGGVIDNKGLDRAITKDLTPDQYQLGTCKLSTFSRYTAGHTKGTIIHFENIHDGIKNSLKFLKKIIAMYFRFSLLDKNFSIYMNGEKITHHCLDDLASKTEFLWEINNLSDPYIDRLKKKFPPKEIQRLKVSGNLEGFIASVEKPRDLKVISADERISVDLFVNGRLRERDILKHIPTARIVENYLYGQVHFNDLDDSVDRFTSSREGIVAADPKYKALLSILRNKIISKILYDWDPWRRKHKEDGDPENTKISAKDRKSGELYNVVSKEYTLPKDSKSKKRFEGWIDDMSDDAMYNFSSYAECFISENLIRRYIQYNKIPLSKEAKAIIKEYQKREKESKDKGNISIQLRKMNTKLSYLSMDDLANLVDKGDANKDACLSRDAKEYKPIRDALAHTALLTDKAKQKLTTVYDNIKGRIISLLSKSNKNK